ncbi:MAG TPA: VOC family protein [Burkholderiales bacterium]
MRANRSMPSCTVIPELAYPDVAAAVRWLATVYGFTPRLRIGEHRAQLLFDDGAIVVTQRAATAAPGEAHALMVRVGDLDGHYARTRAAGAAILREPADYPYGERQYTARDIGGHVWTFSQTIADVAPEDWGGSVG